LAYQAFLAEAGIGWAEEPRGLESSWKKLGGTSQASPKLWMDAYLAAFAIAGGYQLVTTDKGFKQFKGLDLLVLSSP
jgi:predicted nucleic acid-binding protein